MNANTQLETLLWSEQDNILTPELIAQILRLVYEGAAPTIDS
jgi:hypothetical protein